MAEQINKKEINIWDAVYSDVEVEFTEDGYMIMKAKVGLFALEGNKVADSRPSKSSGKTDVVYTTGGNKPVKTLKNGKVLNLGITAYVK